MYPPEKNYLEEISSKSMIEKNLYVLWMSIGLVQAENLKGWLQQKRS
jgi:hypothetical protein